MDAGVFRLYVVRQDGNVRTMEIGPVRHGDYFYTEIHHYLDPPETVRFDLQSDWVTFRRHPERVVS